ncbi:MAG: hypothetical protein AAFR22_22595, partial [Chloroflexota bacterium]
FLFDGGYASPALLLWCEHLFGVCAQIARRITYKGFEVIPERWIVTPSLMKTDGESVVPVGTLQVAKRIGLESQLQLRHDEQSTGSRWTSVHAKCHYNQQK